MAKKRVYKKIGSKASKLKKGHSLNVNRKKMMLKKQTDEVKKFVKKQIEYWQKKGLSKREAKQKAKNQTQWAFNIN
jgi:hypothetical protein